MSVERSKCDRYDVREGRTGWAIVMIDERGGVMQICSDYGNWSHAWPYHGRKTFRHFLVEIDEYYLINKLHGRPDYFNEAATKKEFKRIVCESRKHDDITKGKAREAFDEIIHGEWSCAEDVYSAMCDADTFDGVFDPAELPIVYEYPPNIVQFSKRIWPVFLAAIKAEIEAAEAAGGASVR